MFFVGASLCAANVAIASSTALALAHGFGIAPGWGFFVLDAILVATLSAALAIGVSNWLMHRFSSDQEFADFAAMTSRSDTKWSILWFLIVCAMPTPANLPAFHYFGLPLEGVLASQAGAMIIAWIVWLPFMRSLRDPASGPVPQIITTEQMRGHQKQDLATIGILSLVMTPAILMFVLVAVARP